MAIIGPTLSNHPHGRRCRVLWIDAQVLVDLFADMDRTDRMFTISGMPRHARVVGHVFESYVNAQNEQRIGLLIESEIFDEMPKGTRFPDLDVVVTQIDWP